MQKSVLYTWKKTFKQSVLYCERVTSLCFYTVTEPYKPVGWKICPHIHNLGGCLDPTSSLKQVYLQQIAGNHIQYQVRALVRTEVKQSLWASLLEFGPILCILSVASCPPTNNLLRIDQICLLSTFLSGRCSAQYSHLCHLSFGLDKPSSQFYPTYHTLQYLSPYQYSAALLYIHISLVLWNPKLHALSRCDKYWSSL